MKQNAFSRELIDYRQHNVESTLDGLLTLAMNFLEGFVGLGRVADKVMKIVKTKVWTPIDKALEFVITWS